MQAPGDDLPGARITKPRAIAQGFPGSRMPGNTRQEK
jgi:hypothetical protein